MVINDNPPVRLWIGPLLLIFIVTIIYIFSILPQTRSSIGMDPLPSHPSYGKSERIISSFRMVADNREEYADEECNRHGHWNGINGSCDCINRFEGHRCSIPICSNGGIPKLNICRCPIGFGGEFCEYRCIGGMSENTNVSSRCLCEHHKFGPRCEFICLNGKVEGGECVCHQGWEGVGCEVCSPSSSSCINSSSNGRSSINSRLTLSGLSFCLITIGLLCVTASRRRSSSSSQSQRFFSLRNHRNTFGYPSTLRSSSLSRSSHIRPPPPLTPPPIYRSIDNLSQSTSPPSYEEATAIQIDPPQEEFDDDKTTD